MGQTTKILCCLLQCRCTSRSLSLSRSQSSPTPNVSELDMFVTTLVINDVLGSFSAFLSCAHTTNADAEQSFRSIDREDLGHQRSRSSSIPIYDVDADAGNRICAVLRVLWFWTLNAGCNLFSNSTANPIDNHRHFLSKSASHRSIHRQQALSIASSHF